MFQNPPKKNLKRGRLNSPGGRTLPAILDALGEIAKSADINQIGQQAASAAGSQAAGAASTLASNPLLLIVGILLIAATIFIVFFLKKFITNAVLGGILWAASVFFFKVQLPLIPSLVISIIFGPAGIGAMLLLKFFGLLP